MVDEVAGGDQGLGMGLQAGQVVVVAGLGHGVLEGAGPA